MEMPHDCNDEIVADDGSGRTICEFPYGLNEDSAFIVRAVNAHDELVAALRDMIQWIHAIAYGKSTEDYQIVRASPRMDAAKEVLAKATGEGA
jgi:hypothetical protein